MPVMGTLAGRFINPTKTVLTPGFGPHNLMEEMCEVVCSINRYGGHAGTYSVGAHTMVLHQLWQSVREHSHLSRIEQEIVTFLLLTHDLHEAYVTDMPRPLKRMMPEYVRIEKRVQAEVFAELSDLKEGLLEAIETTHLTKCWPIVHFLDTHICSLWEIPLFTKQFYILECSHCDEADAQDALAQHGLYFLIHQMIYDEIIVEDEMSNLLICKTHDRMVEASVMDRAALNKGLQLEIRNCVDRILKLSAAT